MSIRGPLKWLALSAAGLFLSGCVAAPSPYAAYPQAVPGSYVTTSDTGYVDPAYSDGGYYEVYEVYEEPYYRPSYPTFGSSLSYHYHSGHRHRHKGNKHHHKHDKGHKHRDKKKVGKRTGNKRKLTQKQIDRRKLRRDERRAARQTACQEAGYPNCKALNRAERRAVKEEAAPARRPRANQKKIRPANKRLRRKRRN